MLGSVPSERRSKPKQMSCGPHAAQIIVKAPLSPPCQLARERTCDPGGKLYAQLPGDALGAKLRCKIRRTPIKRLSENRAPETYSYLALVPLHASFGLAHIQGRVVQPGEKHKNPASASAATACLAPPRVGTRAPSALPEGPGKGSPGSARGGRRDPRPAGQPAPIPAPRSTFSRRRNAVDGDTAPVPYPIKSLCSSSCLSGKREIPSSMSGSG